MTVTVAWIFVLGFLMIQIRSAHDGIITDFLGNPVQAIVPRVAWECHLAMVILSAVIGWVFRDRFSPQKSNGSVAPLWGATLTLATTMIIAIIIGQPETELGQRTNTIVLQWLVEGAFSVASATVLGILISWNIANSRNRLPNRAHAERGERLDPQP
ncbi:MULTISPECIES: hypothetical protein [unclassified Arthrobacter]|uniref:hypothetical protein n=1 Tax=unclassified Arthrobacter TaxID=235627 RepID=UPI002883395D|nr:MULTISPECIES: hypothetical protein [unclassified Arthrobacter]